MTNKDLIAKLYKVKQDNITGYCFAIIVKNSGEWYNPATPSGRIKIIGYFNDSGAELEPTDQLERMAYRELKACGEFADTLTDSVDYLSIGRI